MGCFSFDFLHVFSRFFKKLDIHDAKNTLADAALQMKSPEELKRMNVDKLDKLFGNAATHVRGKRGRLDVNAPVLPYARPNLN